jgi:hypothetical protein
MCDQHLQIRFNFEILRTGSLELCTACGRESKMLKKIKPSSVYNAVAPERRGYRASSTSISLTSLWYIPAGDDNISKSSE